MNINTFLQWQFCKDGFPPYYKDVIWNYKTLQIYIYSTKWYSKLLNIIYIKTSAALHFSCWWPSFFHFTLTHSLTHEFRSVHVPNCKSVFVTEAERKHVRRRARFQKHGDASCHQAFFFLQGKVSKEIHAILTETVGEHAPSYATIKNWVAQFQRGYFSTCGAPRPGRPKTVTTPEITDQIHELILEDHRISAKSIAEQLGISVLVLGIRWCGAMPLLLHAPSRRTRGQVCVSLKSRCLLNTLRIPPTQYIYVVCVDLRANSDYFLIQH